MTDAWGDQANPPDPTRVRLLAGTLDGAFAVDRRQCIAFWNEAARRILGLEPDSVLGRPCHEILGGTDDHGYIEQTVLRFLASGATTEIICSRLDVQVTTVRTHVQHIMAKLGVHSRLEAVACGAQLGLLQRRTD